MALSRVASGNSASNVVTFSGSYAAGDIIVVNAINVSSASSPATPTGYTGLAAASDSTDGFAMGTFYKVAASSSEASITISNCTSASWAIYRGQNSSAFSNTGGQAGTTSTISYSGITTMTQRGGAGTSWVLCFAAVKGSASAAGGVPPTSMTLIAGTDNTIASPASEVVNFDTNAPASSYSFNSKTLSAAAPWLTKTAELNAAVASSTPTNLFFF